MRACEVPTTIRSSPSRATEAGEPPFFGRRLQDQLIPDDQDRRTILPVRHHPVRGGSPEYGSNPTEYRCQRCQRSSVGCYVLVDSFPGHCLPVAADHECMLLEESRKRTGTGGGCSSG